MDYKALLEKYMAYIVDVEGADFVLFGDRISDIKFTDEEWEALKSISKAIE